jgi:hypothetical protein
VLQHRAPGVQFAPALLAERESHGYILGRELEPRGVYRNSWPEKVNDGPSPLSASAKPETP